MAAPQDRVFLNLLLEHSPPTGRCADVGSLDVNGSPRAFVVEKLGMTYHGYDLQMGRNVDSTHDIVQDKLPRNYDLVLCLNTLEHIKLPLAAVTNLWSSVAPGGILALAAPEVWPEHDFPGDYWRFMPQGLLALVEGASLGSAHVLQKWRQQYKHPGEINGGIIALKPVALKPVST